MHQSDVAIAEDVPQPGTPQVAHSDTPSDVKSVKIRWNAAHAVSVPSGAVLRSDITSAGSVSHDETFIGSAPVICHVANIALSVSNSSSTMSLSQSSCSSCDRSPRLGADSAPVSLEPSSIIADMSEQPVDERCPVGILTAASGDQFDDSFGGSDQCQTIIVTSVTPPSKRAKFTAPRTDYSVAVPTLALDDDDDGDHPVSCQLQGSSELSIRGVLRKGTKDTSSKLVRFGL